VSIWIYGADVRSGPGGPDIAFGDIGLDAVYEHAHPASPQIPDPKGHGSLLAELVVQRDHARGAVWLGGERPHRRVVDRVGQHDVIAGDLDEIAAELDAGPGA
jgi:hypothetical protein